PSPRTEYKIARSDRLTRPRTAVNSPNQAAAPSATPPPNAPAPNAPPDGHPTASHADEIAAKFTSIAGFVPVPIAPRARHRPKPRSLRMAVFGRESRRTT